MGVKGRALEETAARVARRENALRDAILWGESGLVVDDRVGAEVEGLRVFELVPRTHRNFDVTRASTRMRTFFRVQSHVKFKVDMSF